MRRPSSIHAPSVSVVMPVLDERRDIERLLREILDQKPPVGDFEVIVADGGSTDGTPSIVEEIAQQHSRVRLVKNPGRLSSSGRNVGARNARGKYVVFIDGHCELPRADYLVRVVDIFTSTGADCLSRPQPVNVFNENRWGQAIAAARHSWLGHNPGSDIYGGEPGDTDPRHAGAAYTRECLTRLGGYDERFDACEDVEFNHRVALAGMRAYRHPDLSIHYRPRSSLRGVFRQVYRYGRGRARLMARHPRVVPWPIVVVAIATIVLPAVLLILSRPIGVLWIGSVVLGWVGITTVETLRLSGLRGMGARILLAFAAIHAGMVLGFCRGLLEYARFRRELPSAIGRSLAGS